MPVTVELRLDKTLFSTDFVGYKLSLQSIPHRKQKIDGVHQQLPDPEEHYTYKHAKLFTLHNHLVGETIKDHDLLYYIDKKRHVQQATLNVLNDRFGGVATVWRVPQTSQQKYNLSMAVIAGSTWAMVCDGNDTLYILATGDRANRTEWKAVYSESLAGNYVIKNCRHVKGNYLHCLLYRVEKDMGIQKSCLLWIVFERQGTEWRRLSREVFRSAGEIYAATLDADCEAVYVSSANGDLIEENPSDKRLYFWWQSDETITMHIYAEPKTIQVNSSSAGVFDIIHNGDIVISGVLQNPIDEDLTTWSFEDGICEIKLYKKQAGLRWGAELIPGDTRGEYLPDPSEIRKAHIRLAHLTTDAELSTASSMLNVADLEECDFPHNSTTVLERITRLRNVSHRVHLGSQQVLFTKQLDNQNSDAYVVQQDEHACLWQPKAGGILSHVGTLMAFNYVQASKQRRKYLDCAPNLCYAAVGESSRHVFIYNRARFVGEECELRNRLSGKRTDRIAQQQVADLGNAGDFIGMHCSNRYIYVLSMQCIHALKMQQDDSE